MAVSSFESGQFIRAQKGTTVSTDSPLDVLRRSGANAGLNSFLLKGMDKSARVAFEGYQKALVQGGGFGPATSVSLSEEALRARFGRDWQAAAEQLRLEGQADPETIGPLGAALAGGGINGLMMKVVVDQFFKGGTSDEAWSARRGVDRLVQGMVNPMPDYRAQVSVGTTNPNLLVLKGSNGTMLRLEMTEGVDGQKTLNVVYSSLSEGSVETTIRRYVEAVPGPDGKPVSTDKISVDTKMFKARGGGQISGMPTEESYIEGKFRVLDGIMDMVPKDVF